MPSIRSTAAGLAALHVACANAPESGSPAELIPLQTLLAPATNLAPQVSPDGRWISFLRPVEGALNFFVAPVDSIDRARAITTRRGRGIQGFDVSGNVLYKWTPDSRRILFPQDKDGDERWNLHVVDVVSAEEKNLTPLPGVQVTFLTWSEDDPNLAAIAVRDRNPMIPDLYRLDLTTGERTLIMRNDRMVAIIPDHRLRPRVGIAIAPDGTIDLYKPAAGGDWSLLWDIGPEDVAAVNATAYLEAWRVDRENKHVIMFDTEGRDLTALVAVDMETGQRSVIAEASESDMTGVLYHPVTFQLQAWASMWTRTNWHVTDSAIAGDFERLGKVMDGDLKVVSRSDDLGKWIVQYMMSDAPITYMLYDRASGATTKLFTGTPALEGLKLSRLHPYEITTTDGMKFVSYYLLPPESDPDGDGKPATPLPTVMLVHGGPSDERAQWAFGPFVHWLANRGYAVLYVNYRGSAGFGKKMMNAQKLEWGGRMHTDLLEQVDWAVAQGISAKDRVAILGGSYGGYAVLVGMTMTPDRFACGVDMVGPSNLEKFMPHWNVDRMATVVGDPRTEEGRKHLRSRSPINFAKDTKHPVFIGQGVNDSRVPKYQSDTVVAAMRSAGVPVVYAVYPDEGHGFLRPANSFSFWAIGEQFLAKCLGGRAMPLGNALEGSSVIIESGAEYLPELNAALQAKARNTAMDDTQLRDFATRYAAAWSSQDPDKLASFYAESGALKVNEGAPAEGRAAVRATVQSFMSGFPDMLVVLDSVVRVGAGARFHWTWTGTNTGPGGTGKAVKISGYEDWTFAPDGLIAQSLGHYDEAEYQRQVAR
jgi:dipeptidyl aminopeptidase/acylaminoacyl peptidase